MSKVFPIIDTIIIVKIYFAILFMCGLSIIIKEMVCNNAYKGFLGYSLYFLIL